MFNLVAINLPDAHKKYPHKCHKEKCPNEGRYQIFSDIEETGLPDWEGKAICSKHLVEEARHRPEITMSLIDMLIDTMEQHNLFAAHPPEGAAGRQVLQMQRP
jgi:hypothetical protein